MKDSIVIKAEQIAGDFLREEVTSSYLIKDRGIDNQVCVVITENSKVVVRMNDEAFFPSYAKEKWCIEQAGAVGIPGPEVLSIGILDDTAYMIQAFIDGDNGLDSKVSKVEVWRQFGEYTRIINTIQVKGFGENLKDPVRGEFQSPPHAGSDGSWLGYVQYNIDSLTEHDPLIQLGVITPNDSRQVRSLFENLKKDTFRFGLNHGDISLKNTIINHADEVILLDWCNSEVSAVPHGTVAQVMHCQMLGLIEGPNIEEFHAFLDGYGLNKTDLTAMWHLLLLKAFDTLRWAIDQCPDRIEAYAAFAKQAADTVLD
ncbi:aminoglycoside phosphotransferase family protein [Paenibacillus glycanilyticus]|uniref:phosphotransferase n=1 Tax=Paenibacillus glycanilyticus TaxID=126569 RepID=UPI00203EB34B|nr:phosphotransferase [Paenibacillus glycanilyticus]MCM3628457.1 aminoglycoside phosphotransferase family protein [Paenibacillus glycanilyticus]